jgi:hypothetical protein
VGGFSEHGCRKHGAPTGLTSPMRAVGWGRMAGMCWAFWCELALLCGGHDMAVIGDVIMLEGVCIYQSSGNKGMQRLPACAQRPVAWKGHPTLLFAQALVVAVPLAPAGGGGAAGRGRRQLLFCFSSRGCSKSTLAFTELAAPLVCGCCVQLGVGCQPHGLATSDAVVFFHRSFGSRVLHSRGGGVHCRLCPCLAACCMCCCIAVCCVQLFSSGAGVSLSLSGCSYPLSRGLRPQPNPCCVQLAPHFCFLARCCLLLATVLRWRWVVALGRRCHAPPPQHMCLQTQTLGLVHCIVAACSFSLPELAYCSQPSVPCPSLAGPQLHTKKP